MKTRINWLMAFLLFCVVQSPLWVAAAAPTLTLSDSGTGIDRQVTVESPGQFRLVFEASMNYGLSKWYDLVNDPTASIDIAQNPTDYLPAHEQGALFNQCIALDDVIGHVIAAKIYNLNTPRSLTIVENSPIRVVIEVSYSPMLGATVNTNIVFTDRYYIYPDGRIYINHKLHSMASQSVGEWRNSVIGLGDPSYLVNSSSGNFIADNSAIPRTLTDMTKNWMPDQWAGYQVSIGYNQWAITGNSPNSLQIGAKLGGGGADTLIDGTYSISSRSDKLGWIRATNTQNPYSWSSSAAKYLYMYWDPTTPAPYSNWTRTSILLIPISNNPYQGIQATHGWKGFKRWYYSYGSLSVTSGQDIVQQYMMQLGTQGSKILPNIVSSTIADPYANDYLNPSALNVIKGSVVGSGFNAVEGAYMFNADSNELQFNINGTTYKRIKPVFKISNYNSTKEPLISIDGQVMQIGTDFTAALVSTNTLLVQLQNDITTSTTINMTEGVTELPPLVTDIQAPTTPTGLTAVATSTTQINLSWSASSDNVGIAGYRIYRDGVLIASQTGTTYSDTGLTEGATYAYTVAAYDTAGNFSAQCGAVNVTPQKAAPPIIVSRKSYGILDYNSNTSDTILNWINDRFTFKISGKNPGSTTMHWDTYLDIYGPATVGGLLSLKDWAKSNNLKYEDIMLHAKIDYTSAISTAWSQMDKFDAFEGANGVLRTSDDVTYTDLTSTAYSSSVTWQNTMYVAYEEPFDQMNLTLSTPGIGITRVWEYWNGSTWAVLNIQDNTNSFAISGSVNFTPPTGWARRQVNSSRNKYFVRCRITGATTNPVTSSIKGDNWLRGAGNLCRGWDPTSGSIINTGELAYNPTPPAGASAKFRYQARISYWAANHFVANPADYQLIGGYSMRTWARYVASSISNTVSTYGYTGVMCDDGERDVSSDGIASTNTDFVDKTTNTWTFESINKYQDIVSYAHALNPAIKVGINAQGKDFVRKGDWNLAEYHTFNWKTASPTGILVNASSSVMGYDDYLTANNPTGITGVMIYQDTGDKVTGKTAEWDRGNRGPLVALSKHYIAMNDNTIFSYYTQGGYVYSNTDEVFLKDGTVRHQSTDPIPTVDLVKNWATYFPAMGVDIGLPDAAGYNGGVRSLTWISHTIIGGVQDVWRRDFTKAIILHRPASWDTTDAEYNSYSSSIDLGGTYYPLKADGTTGLAVTSIALRAGEGAILMKEPLTDLYPASSVPPLPASTTPPVPPSNLRVVH